MFKRKNKVIQRLTIDPRPLIDKDKKIVLLWSAKAGCTFVIKWYFYQMGLLNEALAYSSWIHDYVNIQYLISRRYGESMADFISNPTEYVVIKMVRNPYDRAVSSYLHANLYKYEDSQLKSFLGRNIDASSRFSFNEFIDYLSHIDLTQCDIHHRLQTHSLEYTQEGSLDYIIMLEKSEDQLKKIERELGLTTAPLAELIESFHHFQRTDTDPKYIGNKIFDLSKEREIPANSNFYDSHRRSHVFNIYREDFENYSYHK